MTATSDVDYLGDSVGFTFTFSNKQSILFDPTNVTVRFTDGAGNMQEDVFSLTDLTRLETGKYFLKYNIPVSAVAGNWFLTVHAEYTPENLKDTAKFYFKIEAP